ncbi:sigma-G-dependent sporulation-specific acid-soluble spore protein CsgA [Alkalihalobacterium elongatum]|uniref:sigma-G-dependent sporulation-specific acid-soluble spore protein CsgA n=1 Tax=Alkalihalobacterium elongatum TaxID=2675466 RepID=UPI001F347254|nr:sigma-G-dependent sporulation-specific acid-soluble spore protein CsgA [Alkalihalobacterium elongatum]
MNLDKSLGYLREALSNYIEGHPICQGVYDRLEQNDFSSEEEFVDGLAEEEMKVLDIILKQEIKHAQEEQDEERTKQLNEVFEQLF